MICDYVAGKVCPPAEIVGYTVQQSVTVKVRDFTLTSKLLSGVVENGANAVSDIQFTLDDPTALETTARAEAFQNAKEKAESLAKAGNFSLGRLLEISETGGQIPYYARGGVMMDMAKTESAVAPTIEAGSQEVSIQLTLKYEIR